MSEATRDALAIVGVFYMVFGAAYLLALCLPTRAHHSHAETRKTQAVRMRMPSEDAPLYGLPSVKRRGEGDTTTSR